MSASREKSEKSVFIRTYGCQMNVYDSERMAGLLKPLGYSAAQTPEAADLVILNTCHIREKGGGKGLFRIRPVEKTQNQEAKKWRGDVDCRRRVCGAGGGPGDYGPRALRSIWSSVRNPITDCLSFLRESRARKRRYS